MPPRLYSKNVSEIETRILDEMSDGQWHPMNKITKKCANKKAYTLTDIKNAVVQLSENGYVLSGANSSFRMPEKYVRQWRTGRGMSMETKDSHSPRFFGGVLEDDGWQNAPLEKFDLLNFRANSHVTVSMIREKVENLGKVYPAEDGLFRVLSKEGDVVYGILKAWEVEDPSIEIRGLRLTRNTYRRDHRDLPSKYLDDLCEFYGRFSYVLLRNSMSSIRKHLPEAPDVQQQIFLWILDAVERYDDTTCIPFAAYLHTSLNRWVHNLNRKSNGRAIADSELNHSRAITAFEAENGRKPSLKELSVILDESLEKVSKDSVSIKMVSNLRSTTTLDSDDFSIHLVARETADGGVENYLDRTLLSAALVSAALEQDEETKGASIIALMSIIDKNWNKDKRLSKTYKGKRSSDLLQYEENLLKRVGEKVGHNYSR